MEKRLHNVVFNAKAELEEGLRPRSLSLHCLCDAEAEASLPGLQIQGVTTASVLWTAASLSVAGYVVYARSRIITGLVYGGII